MSVSRYMQPWWDLYGRCEYDVRLLIDALTEMPQAKLSDLLLKYVRAWHSIAGDDWDALCERLSEDTWDDFRAWLLSEPETTWKVVRQGTDQIEQLYASFAQRRVAGRWDLDEDVEVDGHFLRKGRRRIDVHVILGIIVAKRFGVDIFEHVQNSFPDEDIG